MCRMASHACVPWRLSIHLIAIQNGSYTHDTALVMDVFWIPLARLNLP